MSVDLLKLRQEYSKSTLLLSQLDSNPFKQFEVWMGQAIEAELTLPNAVSLATSNADEISIRTVLVKFFDEQGFVFFTNYHSKKSKQIEANPKAALLFSWLDLERQVKISGTVGKISTFNSLKYFSSRPKGSQLAAWASKQSSPLSSKDVLLSQFKAMKNKFSKGEVPFPDFWGGYRVVPETIEFWQGRENRLHDRFVYKKNQNKWLISRLSP